MLTCIALPGAVVIKSVAGGSAGTHLTEMKVERALAFARELLAAVEGAVDGEVTYPPRDLLRRAVA